MEEDRDNESSPEERSSQLLISSVRTMAESVVEDSLSDDLIAILAAAVNHRNLAMTTRASQYMRHAHRHILTVDDMNLAYESVHSAPLDLEEIITTSRLFNSLPFPRNLTRGGIAGAARPSSSGTTPSHAPMPVITVVSDELIDYYNTVTHSILSKDETAIKLALSDLQKNAHISPLLPNLVNFIMLGIEELSHDIHQLTKLLQSIRAIVINPYLFIGYESYLRPLVHYVFNCVAKFPVSTDNTKLGHWDFKTSAAQLLVKIHKDWASPVNLLFQTTLRKFEGIFADLEKPLYYHYGAIIGVTAFGVKAMETFLYPHIPSYMDHLRTILNDHSYKNAFRRANARKIRSMLVNVAIQIIQPHINEMFITSEIKISNAPSSNHPQATNDFSGVLITKSSESEEQSEDNKRACDSLQITKSKRAFDMYKVFCKYFGDRFRNSVPRIPINSIDVPPKKKWMKPFFHPTEREIVDHLTFLCYIDPLESKRRPSDDRFPHDECKNHDYRKNNHFRVKKTGSRVKFTIADKLKERKAFTSDKQNNPVYSNDLSSRNLGNCDDLQVSERVSDPNSGVKLVIAKNSPKSKLASKRIKAKDHDQGSSATKTNF